MSRSMIPVEEAAKEWFKDSKFAAQYEHWKRNSQSQRLRSRLGARNRKPKSWGDR